MKLNLYCRSVAINLNPYQGLKREARFGKFPSTIAVAINLNPYQGLKRRKSSLEAQLSRFAINLNPYQGLKPKSILA